MNHYGQWKKYIQKSLVKDNSWTDNLILNNLIIEKEYELKEVYEELQKIYYRIRLYAISLLVFPKIAFTIPEEKAVLEFYIPKTDEWESKCEMTYTTRWEMDDMDTLTKYENDPKKAFISKESCRFCRAQDIVNMLKKTKLFSKMEYEKYDRYYLLSVYV